MQAALRFFNELNDSMKLYHTNMIRKYDSNNLISRQLRTWSAPPRRTIVAVCPVGHPLKILNLSFPTCFSSNTSHVPRTFWKSKTTQNTGEVNQISYDNGSNQTNHTSSIMLLTDVWTVPPVAAATRCRSSSATRPAQKISLSAKYCKEGELSMVVN